MVLFGKEVEPSGGSVFLEEVDHWGWASTFYSLATLPVQTVDSSFLLLPSCFPSYDGQYPLKLNAKINPPLS